MPQSSKKLRTQVLFGLGTFVLFVVCLVVYQLKVLRMSELNHRILGEVDQLEVLADQFDQSSTNYQLNAPRDPETYSRDVQVFYHDIRADVTQFAERLEDIEDQFKQNVGLAIPSSLLGLFGGHDFATVEEVVAKTRNDWTLFHADFLEQLGTSVAEPRLEWATKYIVDNAPELKQSVRTLVNEYRTFLEDQSRISETVLKLSLVLLLVLGIASLVWFYTRVTKRVGETVDACVQVANGDFGYSLKITGNDELTVLAKAFNTLSSRSQLIVNMLSDLQQSQSIEECLTAIVQASGSYLPVAWAGFIRIDPNTRQMVLNNALPPKTLDHWEHKTIDENQKFAKQLADSLVSNEALMFNELRQYILHSPKDNFLRDLLKTTQLESLVALPLNSHQGWQGIVMFGSRSAQYRKDQTELLSKLGPSMALSFERLGV